MIIDSFRGKYMCFSNFYHKEFMFHTIRCKTAEHMFQAMKAINSLDFKLILNTKTPGQAKRMGRELINIKSDWENTKVDIMYDIVKCKFEQDPDALAVLLSTGNTPIIEGNTWGDRTWGAVKNAEDKWEGKNYLGKILMILRRYFREINDLDTRVNKALNTLKEM